VTTRRFPAPWSVRELEQAFVVVDANGQAVAYTIITLTTLAAAVHCVSRVTETVGGLL
jgi:hypothetical protein